MFDLEYGSRRGSRKFSVYESGYEELTRKSVFLKKRQMLELRRGAGIRDRLQFRPLSQLELVRIGVPRLSMSFRREIWRNFLPLHGENPSSRSVRNHFFLDSA